MASISPVQSLIADRVPTHVITGFLGAGKTTLLKHLLSQKLADENWAILVNEFGQIGLDGALLEAEAGVSIYEVAGGCLCCTSQLPMQVGLARLLTKAKPTRLFIEPTGLGHPLQLIEQLTEPHWARALDLRAVVCVVDGTRLFDERLTGHETYQAQWALADVLSISHHDQMSDADQIQLQTMLDDLAGKHDIAPIIYKINHGQLDIIDIDLPRRANRQTRRSLLHLVPPKTASIINDPTTLEEQEAPLPYHYHEQALAQSVGGWRLPAEWLFNRDQLLTWLLSLQGWLRIKGVIHVQNHALETGSEWLALNLIPGKISFTSHAGHDDNRLEIITEPDVDWERYEQALMACLVA
ncbi:CobW family GTP-binding protein [Aquirhabdus sp.]|uniref:CobW family GTP-binding protein n=1 Tax=Aquirhabdus sp. TaxID=2824160 RepID=UPI00396C46BD